MSGLFWDWTSSCICWPVSRPELISGLSLLVVSWKWSRGSFPPSTTDVNAIIMSSPTSQTGSLCGALSIQPRHPCMAVP